jgi:hypothetical protein
MTAAVRISAVALTILLAADSCDAGSPRGNQAPDCPAPPNARYFAGNGVVADRMHVKKEGCTESFYLQVQQDSDGQAVWFKTDREGYGPCKVGARWTTGFLTPSGCR